jgi:hypothetical protein
MLVMALVAVTLVGVLTPICTMPDCEDTSAGSCSDFQPACDDCPDAVVMKHVHDDAVSVSASALVEPVILAEAITITEPSALAPAFTVPDATASPPPLDPLGVRLSL